ncbi:MAG: alpha/beta hydrolase, partial [Pseudomonadota bacterium]|nr:alpha/beta hydrolase [Pseudomonadota bacterium]
MKRGAKYLIGAAAVVAALWVFGPYESLSPERAFDASVLDNGVDTYLEASEAQVDGIRPGAEK